MSKKIQIKSIKSGKETWQGEGIPVSSQAAFPLWLKIAIFSFFVLFIATISFFLFRRETDKKEIIKEKTGSIVTTIEKVMVKDDEAIQKAINKITPSLVTIFTAEDIEKFYEENDASIGVSGIILTSDGLIAAPGHFFAQKKENLKVITSDAKVYSAQIAASDPLYDLAFLKIEADNLPSATLGSSLEVNPGETIIMVKKSQGKNQVKIKIGNVEEEMFVTTNNASLRQWQKGLDKTIRISATEEETDSGAIIIDLGSNVLAMQTVYNIKNNFLSFPLPTHAIKSALDSYFKNKAIVRPVIDVPVEIFTLGKANLKEKPKIGVLVLQNQQNADIPEEQLLLKDDYIIAINDKDLEEGEWQTAINSLEPDKEATLKILRKGKEITLTQKVGIIPKPKETLQ